MAPRTRNHTTELGPHRGRATERVACARDPPTYKPLPDHGAGRRQSSPAVRAAGEWPRTCGGAGRAGRGAESAPAAGGPSGAGLARDQPWRAGFARAWLKTDQAPSRVVLHGSADVARRRSGGVGREPSLACAIGPAGGLPGVPVTSGWAPPCSARHPFPLGPASHAGRPAGSWLWAMSDPGAFGSVPHGGARRWPSRPGRRRGGPRATARAGGLGDRRHRRAAGRDAGSLGPWHTRSGLTAVREGFPVLGRPPCWSDPRRGQTPRLCTPRAPTDLYYRGAACPVGPQRRAMAGRLGVLEEAGRQPAARPAKAGARARVPAPAPTSGTRLLSPSARRTKLMSGSPQARPGPSASPEPAGSPSAHYLVVSRETLGSVGARPASRTLGHRCLDRRHHTVGVESHPGHDQPGSTHGSELPAGPGDGLGSWGLRAPGPSARSAAPQGRELVTRRRRKGPRRPARRVQAAHATSACGGPDADAGRGREPHGSDREAWPKSARVSTVPDASLPEFVSWPTFPFEGDIRVKEV